MRGHRKPRRETPYGQEAQCSKCKEWWFIEPEPDGCRDGIGFRMQLRGCVNSWCLACEAEAKKVRRARMAEPQRAAA